VKWAERNENKVHIHIAKKQFLDFFIVDELRYSLWEIEYPLAQSAITNNLMYWHYGGKAPTRSLIVHFGSIK